MAAVGRERETRKWLAWVHAWAHEIVLERRKDIVTKLREFERAGDLTIVKLPGQDVDQVADAICRIKQAGLMPEENGIGVDPAGIGAIVDELTTEDRGIDLKQIVAVSQGWKLNGAIKTTERALAGGDLVHAGQPLMAWSVGNAKVVPAGNAITITKQVSGTAKIDPLMALFNAVSLMALNPTARGTSVYESRGIRFL
ncbi:terminase TerL endonuclease subunit [Stenotrophomonas maltophilia]|uniref:terminase TerL endonuclease subunit n=1 Tax=Stenotrophomonas maltophilia TaxID=40324 RepID=UPI001CB906C3|nr:terminase TerL endonuclease subunit [Stenotrophomonas maltophilia]